MNNDGCRGFADGVRIDDVDFGNELSVDQHGRVLCWVDECGAWNFAAGRRRGITAKDAEAFDEWARQRAYLLAVTLDPNVDGWVPRVGQPGWQLTYTRMDGPLDPFLM